MPMAIPAVASAVTSFGLTASASLYAATGLYLSAAAISATAVAAANVAISVAVNALMQPKVGASGPVGSYKSDPAAPIRGVMGRMAIGGNRIFKRTWGRTNVYLTSVALLSLGPCQAVEQFKANDQFVSFSQGQGGASGKFAGHMWMTYRYGLPGTSALTPPQGVFIENPKLTAWTSQHRADGHVTAMWTLAQAEDQQKRDLYTQGEPDALWIGRWMKAHDPRKDSTYPGGSGSQRRDQWNTWAYTDNPYLHALAWIRGHAKLNADGTVDRTKRIAGVGAPERAIDIAAYVEGANIADANGWKIAGEWSTSDDKWQVLAAMLQAGGGVPLNRGAQISCMVNTPRASIYTYTRNDLVGRATVKALKARRDRKNTVVPRYRSEAHGWEIVPAGAVTSSVYRTEDRGEPRTIEIEYSYVTSSKQAGELGAYDVANMREGLETSLPSKPHLLGLRAGDAFTTDLPELGLVARKFIVQRRAFDPQTGVVTLDVLSETDAKHAWALGQTANPPPTPSLVGVDPDYVAPPELPDWNVVIRPPATDGTQQPGFTIIGGSPAADASSVIMEHGPSATGPWTQFYDGALKTTGQVDITGLQSGEVYYVAVRYRRDDTMAESERVVYGPYTAPDLLANAKVNPEDILDLPPIKELEEQGRTLLDELLKTANDRTAGALKAATDRRTAIGDAIDRLNLVAETDPIAGAAILRGEVLVQGEGGQTLAQTLTVLRAADDNAEALVALEQLARVAADLVEAEARLTAIAALGDDLAAADLTLRSWTNGRISEAVAGLATVVAMNNAIAASALNLRSYADSQIATATAGLASNVSVDNKVASATVTLRSEITQAVASGTAGLATASQLNEAKAAAAVDAQSRVDLYSAQALLNFVAVSTFNALQSTVGLQGTAVSGLQAQNNLARLELFAQAGGGQPARLALVSNSLGSALALLASQIYFGDNTVFDDASDTLQTVINGRRRVLALGAPFGVSSDLIEWYGPDNVGLGSMTTTNGHQGRMKDAPYVFDNVLTAGGGGPSPVTGSVRFTGEGGYGGGAPVPANVAGQTGNMNVPGTGKFVVDVNNVFALSDGAGSNDMAISSLALQIGKNGNWTTIASSTASTSETLDPGQAMNAAPLNIEVQHSFAGNVAFRIVASGGGSSAMSRSTITGSLRATWYPA